MSDRHFIAMVTGGTGFLGRRLVAQLLDQGAEVRCLVRPGRDASDLVPRQQGADGRGGVARVFIGSVNRPASCLEAMRGADVVYHLAAALGGGPAVLFANNVVPLRGLLETAAKARVGRFVLVSSLSVHGIEALKPGDTLDEDCQVDPAPHLRDPYGYSKIEQEAIAWEAHRRLDLPVVVVRPGVIFGPGRDPITNRVGLRLGDLVLRMGGSQRLPYTYVDNCAAAVRLAGTVPGVEGQAFNIVDDGLPAATTLLKQYRRQVKRLRVVPVPRWAIGPLSAACEWYHRWSEGQIPAVLTRYKSNAQWKPLRYSNAKAKRLLGWTPHVEFAEGLRRSFESLKAAAKDAPHSA